MLRKLTKPAQALYKQHVAVFRLSGRSAATAPGGPPEYYSFVLRDHELAEPLDNEVELSDRERALRAAKWNMRPEDYKPMNNPVFNVGDYPDLPLESTRARDASQDWDDPFLKRNWGEPMFYFLDGHDAVVGDTTPGVVDNTTVRKRQVFWFVLFFGFAYVTYYHIPWLFSFEAPKSFPETRPKDKLDAGKETMFEVQTGLNPKMKELKHNTNYTFDSKYKWDPNKYVVHHGSADH